LSSTFGPQDAMDVGVIEEFRRVDPIRKGHTSFAFIDHLHPQLQWKPLLDCHPAVGLPKTCSGPTFVFIFIKLPSHA
jgi:hypothetical protein